MIHKIAVLGAGVMGSQIAAHFANAGFQVLLFDLVDEQGGSSIAAKSIQRLLKLDPAPLASPEFTQRLFPCNYQSDLAQLASCDLIIEAVAEDLSIKEKLYKNITPHLQPSALLATNTSGLSITKLAQVLPQKLAMRFLGMHFFNPPRYLPLVELVPHSATDPKMVEMLNDFLTTALGKQVVKAHDTPNFIANRLGVFGLLAILYHAERLKIPFEVVDELTGKLIGRPKSATLRTLDLVGLDIFAHVVKTMQDELAADPWHAYFNMPKWLNALIADKALGQKTGKGIYHKTKEGLLIFDPGRNEYRAVSKKAKASFIKELKTQKWQKIWPTLAKRTEPEAQFLYAIFRDLYHYAAVHAATIADQVRDIDIAMRCGFGWKQGIFESWQASDWKKVNALLQEDINTNTTLAKIKLPDWVDKIAGPYQNNQAYAPATNTWVEPKKYLRQPYPLLVGQAAEPLTIIFENKSAFVYTYQQALVISFKTKLGTINKDVLSALQQAVALAEQKYLGLIIWQKDAENFSAGADLMTLALQFQLGGIASLEKILCQFQETMLRIRYAKVPVISAVRGYVFGGGCELMMHTHKTIAAVESYMGLVEVGVGLIPGAGGTKEMAYRASQTEDPMTTLQQYFKQIGMAEVAKSAYLAKFMGYLRTDDIIIMNPYELLFVAYQELTALAAQPFEPQEPKLFPAQGLPAYANLMAAITNLKVGGFASDYDALIAQKLAHVITGGAINPAAVDEAWMLRLERETFLSLVIDHRTQARIEHIVKTGKPLRN
jgi:3-hydroxyacyl-CoA dehydrogenase